MNQSKIRLHGQIFAPCKICIPHIPVGYARGTTPRMEEVEQCREQLPRAPTVGALGDAGAVAENADAKSRRL